MPWYVYFRPNKTVGCYFSVTHLSNPEIHILISGALELSDSGLISSPSQISTNDFPSWPVTTIYRNSRLTPISGAYRLASIIRPLKSMREDTMTPSANQPQFLAQHFLAKPYSRSNNRTASSLIVIIPTECFGGIAHPVNSNSAKSKIDCFIV